MQWPPTASAPIRPPALDRPIDLPSSGQTISRLLAPAYNSRAQSVTALHKYNKLRPPTTVMISPTAVVKSEYLMRHAQGLKSHHRPNNMQCMFLRLFITPTIGQSKKDNILQGSITQTQTHTHRGSNGYFRLNLCLFVFDFLILVLS